MFSKPDGSITAILGADGNGKSWVFAQGLVAPDNEAANDRRRARRREKRLSRLNRWRNF